ncbi:hypothetical protein YC2023_034004 [Brassica napus]
MRNRFVGGGASRLPGLKMFLVSSEVNIITTGIATIRDCYYQSYLASGGTLWLSSSLRSQAMRNSQA